MNTEIRELNINELDAVSGAGLVEIMHDIVNISLAAATAGPTPLPSLPNAWGQAGTPSGSGSGSSPTCPSGCHSPA